MTTTGVAVVTMSPLMHPPQQHAASAVAAATSSSSSSESNSAHKYGQQPGGDTLTDFVTLVCQETAAVSLAPDVIILHRSLDAIRP